MLHLIEQYYQLLPPHNCCHNANTLTGATQTGAPEKEVEDGTTTGIFETAATQVLAATTGACGNNWGTCGNNCGTCGNN